jgi:presenilin-like A22 family membrane protease
MLVGLGTLVGGLFGYLALMTQVARGKPQAGLPLLNGGSILGYIISGTIAIGFGQLWHNITLL